MSGNEKGLVIIPTYNEKENIGGIVDAILGLRLKLDMLVVDDNSPDGTGTILDSLAKERKNLFVMHRSRKMGLGSAYKEGFKFAFKNNYGFVITMDADFSHNPQDLPAMVEEIKLSEIVVGSRYVPGGGIRNWPLYRLLLSSTANKVAKFMSGIDANDFTSGFQCFRTEILKRVDLDNMRSDGYSFLSELKYLLARDGGKISEIPIMFEDRKQGASKLSKRTILEAIVVVLGIGLERFLKIKRRAGKRQRKE
ncbi:MAG: polyprenol monophosphomannose synthase [Candidatus Omnitrophica bacterium]|nr:polyprenol monophosphomannose synthase [Candidatus Omnitrophota bacterium]